MPESSDTHSLNHQANGETILRTGKVVKNKKDEHGMWNYSKLCFNTKYPWESAVASDIEAQQYVLYYFSSTKNSLTICLMI